MASSKGTPAGYSGTPLPAKLGIKAGHRVAVLHAPEGFTGALGSLPAGVTPVANPRGNGPFDVVILFVPDRARLRDRLPRGLALMHPYGALWVGWPKRSSPLHRDLTEDGVREAGLAAGVVDNKVCAIDADWSGLRLVVRTKDRPPRPR